MSGPSVDANLHSRPPRSTLGNYPDTRDQRTGRVDKRGQTRLDDPESRRLTRTAWVLSEPATRIRDRLKT